MAYELAGYHLCEKFWTLPNSWTLPRGHDYRGKASVHVDKPRRGRTKKSLWKWMKRRAAVEPSIGHLKQEHRLERCRLKGFFGDQVNAILSAAGMNFAKLLQILEQYLIVFLYFLFRDKLAWQNPKTSRIVRLGI